jgi:hypothetical protein
MHAESCIGVVVGEGSHLHVFEDGVTFVSMSAVVYQFHIFVETLDVGSQELQSFCYQMNGK